MILFRVVVNPTYADLQWFRFLVKKRPKSSPFYFSTPFKPSVYAVSGDLCSLWYRRDMDIQTKTSKKFLGFIFKGTLKPVFIRVFLDTNLVVIGRHIDGRIILVKISPKSSPLKKIRALNAVFIRVLAVVLRGHIGETRMFQTKSVKNRRLYFKI